MLPRWVKPVVFAAALLPLAWLAWQAASGGLGANPIEAATRYLGDWALNMLLVALAVSPLRRLTRRAEITQLRRMLGLFAFFYAFLHVMSYVGLDQFFAWGEIWKDVVKRRYITAGMAALVILAALAATSPRRVLRAMGGKAWRRLHKLVYVAGPLAVLHYFWMVKADITQPLLYGGVLLVLLGERVADARRRATARRPAQASATVEGRLAGGTRR